MHRFSIFLAAILFAAPAPAWAQSLGTSSSGISQRAIPRHSTVLVIAASAVLPGAGQMMMRQKRSALYLVLEAAGLAFYIAENRDGNRQRRDYRSLSRNVARAGLSPDGPDGDWDYYERMEKYVASGSYDRITGGDVDPETDAETFNGAMWLLARQTYWRDPESAPPAGSDEYKSALAFYLRRAVTPEFLWSWASAPEAYRKYRSAIEGSNDAFRNAEQTLSLIIANHFLSAVDAFASIRMQMRRDGQGNTTLSASLAF